MTNFMQKGLTDSRKNSIFSVPNENYCYITYAKLQEHILFVFRNNAN